MLADIDLLPVGELGLHRLGQDGGGVAASLAALIDAALICDGGAGDVAIPAGDGAATVEIGKHLRAVREIRDRIPRGRGTT